MAIIKCPECQENISSSVTQCIHCGCKITYCPECNSLFPEELETCKNCGYKISIQKASNLTNNNLSYNSNNNVQSELLRDEYVNAWRTQNKIADLLIKGKHTIPFILLLLSGIFVSIPFFEILSLTNMSSDSNLSDYFNAFERLSDLENRVDAYLSLFVTFFFIGVIYNSLLRIYQVYSLSNWLSKLNIDCTSRIKKYLNDTTTIRRVEEIEVQQIELLNFDALTLADMAKKQYNSPAILITSTIISGVWLVIITTTAFSYIKTILESMLLYDNVEINHTNFILKLVAFLIALCISELICNKILDKAKHRYYYNIAPVEYQNMLARTGK